MKSHTRNKLHHIFPCVFSYSIFAAAVLHAQNITSNLVADWPFCGNAHDETGNGHDGTVFGATLTTDRFGHSSKAYQFNGIDNYIQTSWSGILGTQARTVSLWAKVPMNPTYLYALSYGDTSRGHGFNCSFDILTRTTVEGVAFDCSNGWFSFQAVISDSLWHHYVWVVPNIPNPFLTDGLVYRDGQLLTTINTYFPQITWCQSTQINTTAQFDLVIGRNVAGTGYFSGTLDDIRMYDRALSAADILALYNYQPTCGLSVFTNALSDNFICAGSPISIPYSTNGVFYPGNIFTAQLSDSNGNFSKPVAIGLRSDTINGVIPATIPASTPAGTRYRVRVIASDPAVIGNMSATVLTVFARPVPHAGKDTTICRGGSCIIGAPATGGTPAYTYSWSPPEGLSATNISTPIATPDSTKQYIVHVTDKNGCSDSDTISVFVHPAPHAFAGNDTVICRGSGVLLGSPDYGGSGTHAALWTPSTGLTSAVADMPTARPVATTTYHLLITDADGCVDQDSVTVVVLQHSPIKIIASGPTTMCEGDSVRLTVQGSNVSQYWSTGDTARTITVSQGGKYTVSGTNQNGCADIDTITITLLPNHLSVLFSGALEFCDGDSVRLSVQGKYLSKLWSNGDTSSSVLVKKSGTYSIAVKNLNGCSTTSAPVTVTVHPLPQPVIAADGGTQLCEGDSLTLHVVNNYSTYAWSNGEQSKQIVVRTSQILTVTVTDAAGCMGKSLPYAVRVVPKPHARIIGMTSVCSNTESVYHAVKVNGVSYLWSVSGGAPKSSLSGDSLRVLWNGTATGKINLTIRVDSSGCSSDTAITVQVASSLFPTITSSKQPYLCKGDSVILDAGAGYDSYLWSTNETTQSIVVKQAGTFFVTVKDAGGCSGVSKATTISIAQPPQPIISGAAAICQGDSTVLDAGPGFAEYYWSTGSTGRTLVVRAPGKYPVSVVDTTGCSGTSEEKEVSLNPAPTAQILGPHSVCSQTRKDYLTPADTGYSYHWSVIGGNLETGDGTDHISILWGSTGTGTVQLTVRNVQGCTKDTAIAVFIQDQLSPLVTLHGDTMLCAGDSIVLEADAGYSKYIWSTGDSTRSISVLNSGGYFVSVTDAGGCSGLSRVIGVHAFAYPETNLQGPSSVCANRQVFYEVRNDTLNSYQWSCGAGSIQNGAGSYRISVVWNTTGLDTIHVQVSNPAGCNRDTMMIVQISDVLHPTITASGSTELCEGDSVLLHAGSGYATYLWSDSVTTEWHSVTQSGTFSVQVWDAGGCAGISQTVSVHVHPRPRPSISGVTTLCAGDSTALDAGAGYSAYRWSTADTTRFLNAKTAGDYSVMVTDANGCTGVSTPVHITLLQTQKPIVAQTDNTLTSSTALQYQWYRNDTLVAGATAQQYLVVADGKYKVAVIDSNGCKTESDPVDVNSSMETAMTVGLDCVANNTFNAGDRVNIPLVLVLSKNLNSTPAQFRAQIRFAGSVLSPAFSTASSHMEGNDRVVTITASRPATLTQGTLLQLPFIAMLGNGQCATVHLDSLIWIDGQAQVALQNQDCEICVKVCNQGGARLFSASGTVQLFQNRPNPFNAQTVITYEIIEKGATNLSITDMLGRRIVTLVDSELDPGRYEVAFDASTLASGLYMYMLRTPTRVLSRVMQVVK